MSNAQLDLSIQPAFSAREEFLYQLHSNTPGKYKRYSGLPLRYAGGKSLAVGHIMEQLPDNLARLVSPFMGGGSVEIACAKELGIQVKSHELLIVSLPQQCH